MRKQLAYFCLILLTIVDIILLVSVIFYPASSSYKFFVGIFDLCVCVVLWIEFIYGYYHAHNKKRYLKDNCISIFGMLPFDFTFFLRALRLLKLVQLIKIYVIIRDTEESVANFIHKTYLDKIILLAIVFIFFASLSVRFLDSNINNFSTAIWYTMVSMTSTGYGDIIPASISGKLVGIVTMVGGIVIFSLITAVISAAYVSKLNRENHEDLESKVTTLTFEIEKLNRKIDKLTENNDDE